MTDARHAPATARNRAPLLAVLQETLPDQGLLLEVAAGTGEHAAFFAAAFPGLTWQPSDPDPEARRSIAAHAATTGAANLLPPLDLDVSEPEWESGLRLPQAPAAILAINMIHIAPWSAAEGLLRGGAALLPPRGLLLLYGPYRRDDAPTAPSNEAFDAQLRARDPRWGLRRLEEVVALAGRHGLSFERLVEMPANNLSLIFRR